MWNNLRERCAIHALIRGTCIFILLVYRFSRRGSAIRVEGNLFLAAVWGFAEEIVLQAERKGEEGQGQQQGCRCVALDWWL